MFVCSSDVYCNCVVFFQAILPKEIRLSIENLVAWREVLLQEGAVVRQIYISVSRMMVKVRESGSVLRQCKLAIDWLSKKSGPEIS